MWQYAVKVIVSALLIVAVSEIGKRSALWAAALASLPLISLLAFVWLYLDTRDTGRIAELSHGIFWLALPSLVLLLLLPALLRAGWNFWPGLAVSCAATACAYAAMLWLLGRAGIHI